LSAEQKDGQPNQRVTALAARSHATVATAALANKKACIAWPRPMQRTDYGQGCSDVVSSQVQLIR